MFNPYQMHTVNYSCKYVLQTRTGNQHSCDKPSGSTHELAQDRLTHYGNGDAFTRSGRVSTHCIRRRYNVVVSREYGVLCKNEVLGRGRRYRNVDWMVYRVNQLRTRGCDVGLHESMPFDASYLGYEI